MDDNLETQRRLSPDHAVEIIHLAAAQMYDGPGRVRWEVVHTPEYDDDRPAKVMAVCYHAAGACAQQRWEAFQVYLPGRQRYVVEQWLFAKIEAVHKRLVERVGEAS